MIWINLIENQTPRRIPWITIHLILNDGIEILKPARQCLGYDDIGYGVPKGIATCFVAHTRLEPIIQAAKTI
jgi:hypothetical protein